MRLIKRDLAGEVSLTKDLGDDTPFYAILSHTWGEDTEEVSFDDFERGGEKSKAGYQKIQFCEKQAGKDGLQYFWVDTCCINKSNHAELSESIASMFRWYRGAAKCYVYLSDVSTGNVNDEHSQSSWEAAFRSSRWFRRGWTLQELLAPASVEFFSREQQRLGSKKTLENLIHQITQIPIPALQGEPLSQFPIDERLRWTTGRDTKKIEDKAYCLLGIFDVFLPLIYGERENAFVRLKNEIYKSSGNSKNKFVLGFHLERVHMISHFTPRTKYNIALEESLLPKASPGRKIFVLYGLGGIGKTQLAIKFAKDHQSEFSSAFFLDGSSQDSLSKSFISIFRCITDNETTAKSDLGPLTKTNAKTPEEMVEVVIQWLAREDNGKWLLIFDNIDKEPSDDGGFDIIPLFPPRDHGSILITTRLASLSRLGSAQKVSSMTDEEAIELLDECIGDTSVERQPNLPIRNDEISTKKALLSTLGGLPLAISQAGRFINALNIRPETYLELYATSKRDVMDMLYVNLHLQDTDKGSIRTTWTTSLNLLREKVSKQGPSGDYYAAHRLLQLFAYFEPTDLSYDIIRHGIIGNDIPDWFRRTFSSKMRFFSVIKILLDLCLIDNNPSEGSYSMHRVVHDWLCAYVNVGTDLELLRLAVAAISYSAPLVYTSQWVDKQQQLALHAAHISPSLRDLPPDAFLVRYDEMSATDLNTVSYLLDEPVDCWLLMKYDYTLIGIGRLLWSCRRPQEAMQMTLDFLSRCPEHLEDGTLNPTYLLLKYSEMSRSTKGHGFQATQTALVRISKAFSSLGAPSWAVKARNLQVLRQGGIVRQQDGIDIWSMTLNQSRWNTGSVFIHPTWMVFVNLESRLRGVGRVKARKELFLMYSEDARREQRKILDAEWYLDELQEMLEMDDRQD